MKTDSRRQLYYGKYKYRAKLTITGLNRTYYAKTFLEFLKKIEKELTSRAEDNWYWGARVKGEIQNIDLDSIERYINWRNTHHSNQHPKTLMLRIESNTISVFSDDLTLLKTLESIVPYDPFLVVYTQVDINIPEGLLYFVREPKRKFRVYLRGQQVPSSFRDDMQSFVLRYQGTSSEVHPCTALSRWLSSPAINTWRAKYCSSSFFLEYNTESTYTMLMLMFDKTVGKLFALEKRPG